MLYHTHILVLSHLLISHLFRNLYAKYAHFGCRRAWISMRHGDDEMYFYCRTYTQSTDRKLRKPETDDVSIRAASGYALIASISTSTSTSGRDRFFPSAEPKKAGVTNPREPARTRVRHARSALSGEKWRNKKWPVRKAAKWYEYFVFWKALSREHFGTCRGSREKLIVTGCDRI